MKEQKQKVITAIVRTDTHIPYEDKKTVAVINKYMADHRFDYWIHLGDLGDFNEISRYNDDLPRLKKEKTKQTFEKMNKYLDEQQKIIRKNNPHAKFILLEGNHEARLETFMDKHPEMEGLLEAKENLHLDDRGIKWVRSWTRGDLFKLGKAAFMHGLFLSKYHAEKTVTAFDCNIYYGNNHDVMEMPKVAMGDNKTKVGKSLGCECNYNQAYLKGNPTKWQQAFTIFQFFENGMYTEHTIRIFNHKFIDQYGKIYQI
ncbi:MAG: metallophosphoesterase [Candidatus Izemoplasmatales bacterium]|nr:metallophosphoesterase [Candidatus Izemoplasmatales bacterium]